MTIISDVFLSHNWGEDESGRDNHYRVLLVSKALKETGYRTWFNEQRNAGDIMKAVPKRLEQTWGVIIFITRRYYEKVNGENTMETCKLEFNYAVKTKTRSKIVPVVMEQCMRYSNRWTGTVGIHLSGALYIDMSGNLEDRNYISRKMEHLKNELQNIGIQPKQGILRSCFIF